MTGTTEAAAPTGHPGSALDVSGFVQPLAALDALNIPLAQLERRLAELPADQEIIAYCRGPWCVLSFEAVALLRQRGYRVRRLEDGFPEWETAGLPIESAVVRAV